MNYFQYDNGELFCEEVPIIDIAEDVGTPVYIYSSKTLNHHALVYEKAFEFRSINRVKSPSGAVLTYLLN